MPNLLEEMTKEQLLALCKRWERAHCDAGIMGSEYYMDPERVFETVKDIQKSRHRMLLRMKGIKS